jgi:hypothetical protein
MNRIIASILLAVFLGLLFVSLACGGGGYEGDDPKNEPARDAVGAPAEPAGPTEPAPPEGVMPTPPEEEPAAPAGG